MVERSPQVSYTSLREGGINLSLRELAVQARDKSKKTGRHGRLLTVKEIKRIRRRGYRAERELVRKLRGYGFKSVRVPVSAPSAEPLPDVFATRGESLLAFELKAPNAERAYFRKEQVKKLFDFLDMFEVYKLKIAVIGAKFPYKWVFKKVERIDDYVISKEERSNISFE